MNTNTFAVIKELKSGAVRVMETWATGHQILDFTSQLDFDIYRGKEENEQTRV